MYMHRYHYFIPNSYIFLLIYYTIYYNISDLHCFTDIITSSLWPHITQLNKLQFNIMQFKPLLLY